MNMAFYTGFSLRMFKDCSGYLAGFDFPSLKRY